MRLNRHNMFRNRLLERISGICFNDNDAGGGGGSAPSAPTSGGDPGGGDGGGGTPGPSGGGQVQQDAVHSFGTPSSPSPSSAQRVSELLKKGNEDHLSFDDIHTLISFDAPFGGNQQTSPPPASTQPNAAAPTPAQANPNPAPAAPQLSADAKAIIDALRASQTANPAPSNPNPEPAKEQAPIPYYGGEVAPLQVAPNILSAIVGSEDPAILQQAAPAINALVNGIMNRARQDTITHVQNMLSTALATHVPQTVQQMQQTSQLEQQFYSAHKHLDNPALKPLVNQISSLYHTAMRKTDPNFKWTPEHFNTVAALTARQFEKTYGFPLPGAGPVTTNAPPANPQNPQNPAPANPNPRPYMSNGSARPPVVAPTTPQSADLLAFVN